MSDWICIKCHVGVLDPDKKVRSANGLEFGVGCPECGQWNPTILPGPIEPFMSESSGPIESGVKATNPTEYKFGESVEWACEKCEFSPLPTFGIFDCIGHCPECGHDNSHRQELELVAGGIAEMPSIMFSDPDTGIAIDEPNYTIVEGKQVGKFFFDEEIKRFKFEGDMEASAQIFMEYVLRTLNQRKT